MSYQATVVRVKTAPHPNADKLQLGLVMGTQVVIGKDVQDGELMVYFPTDGKLSEEFCKANDLIGYTDPDTKERKGGFFDHRRKVRSQKFRGQRSDGFLAPLSYFASFPGDMDFKEGDSFDTYQGVVICEKYFTPQTLKAMAAIKSGKQRKAFPTFPKHAETEQFAKECDYIPVNSTIWITEKLHGTSFRVGNVWVEEDLPKKWYHKLLRLNPKKIGYDIVNGTRNTVLGKSEKAYYDNESFRDVVIKDWAHLLHQGEIVYGEIVGYTTTGQPIMNPVNLEKLNDKDLKKVYGDNMHYSYGCSNDTNDPKPQQDIYVYRIVRTDEKGNTVEYSWPQVKARCKELGIKYVPEMITNPLVFDNETLSLTYDETLYRLDELVESNLEGSSLIDQTHIREGVVLRVEPPEGRPYWLKAKSFSFKVCEGMIKENDNSIDLEEIS